MISRGGLGLGDPSFLFAAPGAWRAGGGKQKGLKRVGGRGGRGKLSSKSLPLPPPHALRFTHYALFLLSACLISAFDDCPVIMPTSTTNPLRDDLDHVLAHTQGLWDELRGQRLFITGGTGFFGCWLLESFVWANDTLGLNAQAVVLTRNPDAFCSKAPHLASHPAVTLLPGDVRHFAFPEGRFSHVIHAATEASAKLNAERPLLMLDTIIEGTRHTLDFAVQAEAKAFLLTSSGAVYGKPPPELAYLSESYSGAPDPHDPGAVYGEGKRLAELLCTHYHRQHGLETKIARGFAFVGPYLPLDTHFAIGNFIRDALADGPIVVNGDGTPCRSYLYAADLAIWLWTILCRAPAGRPYNVGAGEAVTILETASRVAASADPALPVTVALPPTGSPPRRYVPDVSRAATELGLTSWIGLAGAIRKTIAFSRWPGTVRP